MRIGLNLLYLLPDIVGGTETYAAGLLHGLAQIDKQNEYFVFVNREAAEWPLPEAPNFQRVVCAVQALNRPRRYLFEQLKLPFLARSFKLQLLHSLGYVTPVFLPCKAVVSIHDIIYDYPGSFARRKLLKLFARMSARRADSILTMSKNSKGQLGARLHVSPQKITVTYEAPKIRKVSPAVSWAGIKKRFNLDDMYLLALSSFSPSKNIPRLLQALSILKKELPENMKLVLVGHVPFKGTHLLKLVESLELGRQVIFTGYLPDEELVLLLQHATVFVFPSLYEGFGIPVLEAMAAGVPVACSNAASLPEVAGEAALLFDPLAVDEIAMTIRRLINEPNLRAELVRIGYQNVARFSWKTTAEKTLQVYETLIHSKKYAGITKRGNS
ncbi:MAG: glycosyltransferase family 4 protein [Planctomycetes bacterium]|nr:glycosyltransferase family 4 protein [Planctomycetota bacterium]